MLRAQLGQHRPQGVGHQRALVVALERVHLNAEGRAAGARLIRDTAVAGKPRRTFIYVNNRLEGNALATIDAMIDADSAQLYEVLTPASNHNPGT